VIAEEVSATMVRQLWSISYSSSHFLQTTFIIFV